MQIFMWQDDLIGVSKYINACLHKMSRKAQQDGWSHSFGMLQASKLRQTFEAEVKLMCERLGEKVAMSGETLKRKAKRVGGVAGVVGVADLVGVAGRSERGDGPARDRD